MPKRKQYETPPCSPDPPEHDREEYCTPKRQAVHTFDKLGVSRKVIKEQTGVNRRRQTDILNGPVRRPGKERSGLPCKLDEDTIAKMIKSLHGHYKQRTKSWDDLAEDFGYHRKYRPFAPALSAETVRRYMHDAGYYKCRACQKSWITESQAEKRMNWCRAHQWPIWKWKMVYFSDECLFHQNSRHTEWVIRNEKKRYCSDCIQNRRRTAASQFSVWAMIAVGYKSRLVFYSSTEEEDKELKNGNVRTQKVKYGGPMTQERYAQEILPIVGRRAAFLRTTEGKNMIFQEDNDGGHGTRSEDNICRFKKAEWDIDYIDDWPPNSPDLNPIENVRRILKSRVKLHHSVSDNELKRAVQKEWKAIEHWEIDEFILGSQNHCTSRDIKGKNCGIQARIQHCIDRKGLSTEY